MSTVIKPYTCRTMTFGLYSKMIIGLESCVYLLQQHALYDDYEYTFYNTNDSDFRCRRDVEHLCIIILYIYL